MGSSHITPLSLACRGLLKVALQHQGQTLEEESVETRYLARAFVPGASLWVARLLGKALGTLALHQAWCVDHLCNTVTYDLGPGRRPGAVPQCARYIFASCLSCAEGEAVARGFQPPVHLDTEVCVGGGVWGD